MKIKHFTGQGTWQGSLGALSHVSWETHRHFLGKQRVEWFCLSVGLSWDSGRQTH